VFLVEFAMQRLQPVQQKHVARTSALASRSHLGWRMFLHRELEKFPLGRSAERARNPWVQEPNDRPEHSIRSVRVAAMNTESAPAETEHHRAVSVGEDSIYLPQSQHQ
jgi:hypothetical protein